MSDLEKWIEAALTVADTTGMNDREIIPTWPSDVAGFYPTLTIGALREWRGARESKAGLCKCEARQDLLAIHRVAAAVADVEPPTEEDTLTVKRVKQMAMLINRMSGWLDEAREQEGK